MRTCRKNLTCSAYLLRRFSAKKVTGRSILGREHEPRVAQLLDADAVREAAPFPRCRANPTWPAYLLRRFSAKKVTAPSILDGDISLALRPTARRGRRARSGAFPEVPRESDLACIPT